MELNKPVCNGAEYMIVCLSVSHKTVSSLILEALNISDENQFTRALLANKVIQECVLIQTCHRVEIFFVSSDGTIDETIRQALKLWSTITGVSLDIIEKSIQQYSGKEALKHLFFMTAGLESVVLGEDQILGQVRTAWLKAKDNGATKSILNRTFMKAINTGRLVRNETRINEGAVSISSAAIDLAVKELGDLDKRKALIIGAGEAGSLAAQSLRSKTSLSIIIANRTYDKSLVLAQKISGEAIQFENVLSTIPYVDLVIAAVSVTQPLLREEQIASFAAIGNPKRLLMIDISQPRAIEEKIGSLQGISLKTIADIKELVAQNIKSREAEAEKSKVIILGELERFEAELAKLAAQPLITEICRTIETIRKKELARAVRKMGESDKKKLVILERFSKELTERITQIPIEHLRNAALNNDGKLLSAAKKIFQTRTEDSCN